MQKLLKREGINSYWVIILVLVIIGVIIVTSADHVVTTRLSLPRFSLIKKHLIYLSISLFLFITFSALKKKYIKAISIFVFLLLLCLLVLVPIFGENLNGAKRWLKVFGFSLQPSELLKPFYAVIIATILSKKDPKRIHIDKGYSNFKICIILHTVITSLFLLQPDLGMTFIISVVTFSQLFISGISLRFTGILSVLVIILLFIAYFTFPHFTKRIDSFLNKSVELNYQVKKSLEAYHNGGLWGKGLGEGEVKYYLPDGYSDFIFAIVAEEMGLVFCVFIIGLIVLFTINGFFILHKLDDLYDIYLLMAIIMYFSFQSFFNMAVTINLLPTKGITLPFLSYGGSSIISMGVMMGMYVGTIRQYNMIYSKK